MTTYISLAASATMFPINGTIRTSALIPEMIKDRLNKGLVVSALNDDHKSTIDVIKRRCNLELPRSGGRPMVFLDPGDELFIVQARLPRLAEGQIHSDETVRSAPISFLRWRVPVRVEIRAPRGVPQSVFEEIIDDAYAIALWQRGVDHLKSADELRDDLSGEINELEEAERDWRDHGTRNESREASEAFLDLHLEGGDVLYKDICLYHSTYDKEESPRWMEEVPSVLRQYGTSLEIAIEVALVKYAYRATGAVKDLYVERRLIAPLFEHTKNLYQ